MSSVIDRYFPAEMSKVWSDERKFQILLDIEVLACEAMAELGQIPKQDARRFETGAIFNSGNPEIRTADQSHVIAFLESVAGSWDRSAVIHQGLTSSDILDTTLAVQLNESCDLLLGRSEIFANRDRKAGAAVQNDPDDRAQATGVHAEPITFGLKASLMYDGIRPRGRTSRPDSRADSCW